MSAYSRILGNLTSRGHVRRLNTYTKGQTLASGSWKVVRTENIPEFEISATQLSHAHCGAKYLHLSSNDNVNAFSINFRTVPMDSTGIPHILEHVTLCGSNRFPVRDPFFKMLNRSLSTFMNAMTGPDYTLYPFATQNKKDFYNLLSVYLDSVFNPLLREQDFRQEGWRLEKENEKLIIKGVVFNEMKGVFADPQQLMGRHLLSQILPSHTYGICSGGLPEKIPDLTWQNLKAFHAKHYSPNNARFLSYGDLNLEDHLEAIDKYLPQEKQNWDSVATVPNEPKWSSPRSVNISCAPDPTAPDTSTMAVSFKCADINDTYETFILQILGELLLDGSNAPFYKSLLEPGLGSGFAPTTGYDSHTKDTLFTISLQGMAEDKKERVLESIKNTFEQVSLEGFESDRIEAILHKTELALKQKGTNFGVNLIMALTPFWNHTEEMSPVAPMKINEKINKFKDDLKKNPNFLKEKVKQYFLDNPHQLVMTMSPKESFAEEQQAILDKIEQNLVSNLNEQDKNSLDVKAQELKELQSAVEDINCLPTLKVADIENRLPSERFQNVTVSSVPVQVSVQPTNEVSYFRAFMSSDNLTPELKEYLPLFTSVLTSLGAGKFDYRRLDTEIDLRTGGLSSGINVNEDPSNVSLLKTGILLSSHCLDRNSSRMFELWTQVFNNVHYENPERLKTLINMIATDTVNGIVYRGHSYAMGSSSATVRPGQQLREEFSGLVNLKFWNRLAQDDVNMDDVISKISDIGKSLLNKNHMKIALNSTEKHSNQFLKDTENFLNSISGDYNGFDYFSASNFESTAKSLYYSTPFPIHFCSTSVASVPFEDEDFAPLRIMARLMSLKYLQIEVREKGGAYGAGAAPNSSGTFTFYSYRDPNFEKTLETFDNSIQWLNDTKFTQQDVDEAKLGVFQKIDAPVPPGQRGMRSFISGVSDEMFETHRSRLRNVTLEDIMRVANKYLRSPEVKGVCVIGPEKKELDSNWTVKNLV